MKAGDLATNLRDAGLRVREIEDNLLESVCVLHKLNGSSAPTIEFYDCGDGIELRAPCGHSLDEIVEGLKRGAEMRATLEGWDAPVLLDAPDLPQLDLEWLSSFAGEFAAVLAAHSETPPELPAAMVLAACSTACARRLSVETAPGHTEPTNLYVACALESGNRKSSVQDHCVKPLTDWETEQRDATEQKRRDIEIERDMKMERVKELRKQAARAKGGKEADSLGEEVAEILRKLEDVPPIPRLWVSDCTPEQLGVLLAEQGEHMAWMSSEGGIFEILAGRYTGGMGNLDLVLKAHSGDAERIERRGRDPVYLDRPLLTIGLAPQPAVLRDAGKHKAFRERGFSARFLYFLPPSPLGFRKLEGPPLPLGAIGSYAAGLRAMLDWPAPPEGHYRLTLTPAAYDIWRTYGLDMEVEQRPDGLFEHMKDWAGKAPGAAGRIAGVLHGIKHAHSRPWEHQINAETMHDAVAMMEVIGAHSRAVFGLMGEDPATESAALVWAWVERKRAKACKVQDIWQSKKRSFKCMKPLRAALAVLEERNYIRVEKTDTGAELVTVNPALTIR